MKAFKITLAALMCAVSFVVSAGATNAIPWRVAEYSLTARQMPVRQALETFGVAEGIPVIVSESVVGEFSGAFKDVPAAEFLDRVATVQNLTWYYDGAALYVYSSRETVSMLIDLQYMKAEEVRALMAELAVEDSRFPIKTAANDEIIMVSGPPRYVELVAELIQRADKLREKRTFNELETRFFPLQHSWADNVSFSATSPETTASIQGVASLLSQIMKVDVGSRFQSTNELDHAQQSKEERNRPLILPDNRLNAVIVRDVSQRMPIYERLIKELDVPPRLLEINVTVLEMSKGDALDWQLSLRVAGAHSDFSGAAGQNVDNLMLQDTLVGAGASGALAYLGRHVQVQASVQALREKNKARSISRTSLLTVNNLAAEITDVQSYHARVVGENVASLEEVSAGTTLQIKPRILAPAPSDTNHTPRVWLSMRLSDGGFQTVSVDSMPMARQSTVTTQTVVPEDYAIMLAGYYRDIDEKGGWGIPWLRDIPWIGWIFGGKSYNKQTVQRLFIMSPHIIDVDYGVCSTQDVVEVQMLRQRDLTSLEALEASADIDDSARKEREERIDERREAREAADDEKLLRFREERKFREEQRGDANSEDHEAWEADLDRRKAEYEAAQREKAAQREQETK